MTRYLVIFAILTLSFISRAHADDIAAYASSSRLEVAATKKKLKKKDGIFNEFNYRGTIVRPARPEDRVPASTDAANEKGE